MPLVPLRSFSRGTPAPTRPRGSAAVLALTAALAATLAAAPVPASAAAGPDGVPCAFAEDYNFGPRIPEDTWTNAFVTGGPYLGTGTLTCTLQVATAHDGADLVAVSAAGSDVVALAEYVGFDWPQGYPLYVCTAFTPAGGAPLYWSAARLTEPGGGRWTTDPSAPCAEVGVDGVVEHVDDEAVDPYLCPALRALPGLADPAGPVYVAPDGDVTIAGVYFWDCPPYGS